MTSASPYSKTADNSPTNHEDQRSSQMEFTQFHAELNSLPQKRPPLASTCWLHGSQPVHGHVKVIASQNALTQVLEHSQSNLQSELGGILLGSAFRHEDQIYVEIEAAVPAVTKDRGPVHFKFTADSWAQLHQDRLERYPNLEVVGWFHTHPDLGVFYSGDDVVVHSAAFTLPWQVGLVVDPLRNEACLFGWVKGNLMAIEGFYERHEDRDESATNWQIVKSEVWDNNNHPGLFSKYSGKAYALANQWPALSPLYATIGLLVGAVGLLLGFFLLVGWIIPQNRQIDRLESAVLMLVDETLVDSSVAACPDARLRIITPLPGSKSRVGDTITFLGTADYPDASSYRIESRPDGGSTWSLVDSRRLDTSFGQLAEWNTKEITPGLYEIRLSVIDRNGVELNGSTSCSIGIELLP